MTGTTDIQAALGKVVASRTFAKSPQLRRLLEFCVDSTLRGESQKLKEYTLGIEVFGRGADFDPRTDPIVRVDARRLRAKLKSYYEQEGLNDLLVVHFDLGSYVPVFRERNVAVARSARPPEPVSLAVLPFANFSSDPENEYFSDGLTEETIHSLAQVNGLRVVARSSVFQFKGQAHDIREIGKRLGVRYVLEGSVRKSGETLRVTAQLISAGDGYHLWSNAYDYEHHDVFSIQERLARDITLALRGQFTAELENEIASRAPHNEQAYHLYLKGRHFWNMRTPGGIRKGLECFHGAIAADPSYAVAYAGLADCFCFMGAYGWPPHQMMPRAKSAAEAALAINNGLAEAHATLGAVRAFYDWNWQAAGSSFQSAIAANPNCLTIYPWYSLYLSALGRGEEAIVQIRRAQKLDPLSPLIGSLVGMFLYVCRRYDEAVQVLQETLDLDPNFYRTYWLLGLCYEAQGQLAESLATQEKAALVSARSPSVLWALGTCYSLCGRKAEAELLLAELLRRSAEEHVSAAYIAFLYLGLGKVDETFEWLDKAAEERAPFLAGITFWPTMDKIRDDPRFSALQAKMGLRPAILSLEADR
jgi:TolB-like protein/Flp pilus assembly protein TadD